MMKSNFLGVLTALFVLALQVGDVLAEQVADNSDQETPSLREIIKEELAAIESEKEVDDSFGIEDIFGVVDIHGFISQGFMKSNRNNFLTDSEDGSLQFNEVGINFSTELFDYLRIGAQFISRDLGDMGNNEIELDWAYADYRWRDWLGLRAGKIKTPMGLYNETRDIDGLRTCILLPGSIYTESFRDVSVSMQGFGVYGNISTEIFGDFSYQMQLGTKNIPNDGGYRKVIDSLLVNVDDLGFSYDYYYGGSLIWHTPVDGLRLGATGSIQKLSADYKLETAMIPGVVDAGAPMDLLVDDFQDVVLSAEYSYRDLILAAEIISTRRKITLEAPAPLGKIYDEYVMDNAGYYLGATYRLNKWCELGTYYSSAFEDANDPDGSDFEASGEGKAHTMFARDLAVSVRFDITENWVLKLENHFMCGTSNLMGVDNPKGVDEHWNVFLVKMSFNF